MLSPTLSDKSSKQTNKRNSQRLADALIASRCGTHSLGLVYEFLLKAHGSPKQARADFVSYLSGERPARLLKEARLRVAEEQGWELPTSMEEDDLRTARVPQAAKTMIQASW